MSNIFVNIKESLPMTPKTNAYYSYCVADPCDLCHHWEERGADHYPVTNILIWD